MRRNWEHGSRIAAMIGMGLLGAAALVLVVLGVLGATVHGGSLTVGAVLLVSAFWVGVGIRGEWWFLREVIELSTVERNEAVRITLAILGGTLLTIAFVVELGLSPIVAAGIVGVGAALATPRRAVPVYCGAFVGMTSPTLFVTYWHAIVAGAVASGVYVVAQPVFQGVGGKLGTTAFVGATATVALTSGAFHSAPLPALLPGALVVAYATAGAVITFAIQSRLGVSPVLASGVVGATAGLVLPLVHGAPGGLMAAAVFAASFAGMTAPGRIPDELWIAVVGLLVGLLVIYTSPYLGGSGGKLGTIAFGASLAVHATVRALHIVRLRRRVSEFQGRDTT